MKSLKPRLRNCRWPSSASLRLIALSGCVASAACTTTTPTPLQRQLPAAPSFARPVSVAPAAAGESCFVAYDRQRAGVNQANSIIGRYNGWYVGVRSNYSKR